MRAQLQLPGQSLMGNSWAGDSAYGAGLYEDHAKYPNAMGGHDYSLFRSLTD